MLFWIPDVFAVVVAAAAGTRLKSAPRLQTWWQRRRQSPRSF